MTPASFIAKWSRSELRERQGAQSHFNDLCALLGEPTPSDADPTGATYCFERGATKVGGGDGWADVWRQNCFGWEYKGKHKDLGAALRQLQIYAPDLDNPPYLVVSDMERIVVHTNWTNTVRCSFTYDFEGPARGGQARPAPPDLSGRSPSAHGSASATIPPIFLRRRSRPSRSPMDWFVRSCTRRIKVSEHRSRGPQADPPPRNLAQPARPRPHRARLPRPHPAEGRGRRRNSKERTLTNLYNERPAWLANAHRRLDEAVAAAYGWPADLADDEILARLFALNQERAAAGR